jgi:SAM-dependent methyltransferase
MTLLVPARRSTPEYLDDPATDIESLGVTGREIARCNQLFGGRAALLSELVPLWPALRPAATLLDVGCGVGDLAEAARTSAAAHGVVLTTIGLDRHEVLASRAAGGLDAAVVGDAFALPMPDACVDIVTASQFLHHFSYAQIATLVREMQRVAARRVVISDLRRNWFAAGGLWLASWPLRFHSITRHDGFVSVLKGFEPQELGSAIRDATGTAVHVASRPICRVTASWSPAVR